MTRSHWCHQQPRAFITSRDMSSPPGVVHVHHSLELFLASIALSIWPKVVHVIHNLELFKPYRALTSQLEAVLVIHNPELLMASRALRSRPGVIHINHNPMFFPHPVKYGYKSIIVVKWASGEKKIFERLNVVNSGWLRTLFLLIKSYHILIEVVDHGKRK